MNSADPLPGQKGASMVRLEHARELDAKSGRLPTAPQRELMRLIAQVEKFEPVYHLGDRDWHFYLRPGRDWLELQVKEYQGTWYFQLQRDRDFDRPDSFQFNPSTLEGEGLQDIDRELLVAVRTGVNEIHRQVKADPVAYHARLASTLSPTLRYGVIHSGLLQTLVPDWRRFDLDLGEETLSRAVELLRRHDPDPLPSMTAGRYFDYAKVAYLANPETFTRSLFGSNDWAPNLSGRDLYVRWADGRDGGLRDLPLDSESAFSEWYHGKSWQGGHPFEIFRGGNSTHISLHVSPAAPWDGWRVSLEAFSSSRLVETCRAALALADAGLPCAVDHRESYVLRLTREDHVGIVPTGDGLAYAWHRFPKEFHVADAIPFRLFRNEDTGRQIRPWRLIQRLVTWLPIRPVRCAGR